MLRFFIVTGMVFLLSGCASKSNVQIMNINVGDTKASVVNKLGTPDKREFYGKHEAIQYCATGFGASSYDVIWFYNGRVTGVNAYTVSGRSGICTVHFKNVNWENAPDTVVEVRRR